MLDLLATTSNGWCRISARRTGLFHFMVTIDPDDANDDRVLDMEFATDCIEAVPAEAILSVLPLLIDWIDMGCPDNDIFPAEPHLVGWAKANRSALSETLDRSNKMIAAITN